MSFERKFHGDWRRSARRAASLSQTFVFADARGNIDTCTSFAVI